MPTIATSKSDSPQVFASPLTGSPDSQPKDGRTTPGEAEEIPDALDPKLRSTLGNTDPIKDVIKVDPLTNTRKEIVRYMILAAMILALSLAAPFVSATWFGFAAAQQLAFSSVLGLGLGVLAAIVALIPAMKDYADGFDKAKRSKSSMAKHLAITLVSGFAFAFLPYQAVSSLLPASGSLVALQQTLILFGFASLAAVLTFIASAMIGHDWILKDILNWVLKAQRADLPQGAATELEETSENAAVGELESKTETEVAAPAAGAGSGSGAGAGGSPESSAVAHESQPVESDGEESDGEEKEGAKSPASTEVADPAPAAGAGAGNSPELSAVRTRESDGEEGDHAESTASHSGDEHLVPTAVSPTSTTDDLSKTSSTAVLQTALATRSRSLSAEETGEESIARNMSTGTPPAPARTHSAGSLFIGRTDQDMEGSRSESNLPTPSLTGSS